MYSSLYSQDVSVNEGDRRSEVPVISEIHKTLCNICISCQSMQNVLKYEIHTTKPLFYDPLMCMDIDIVTMETSPNWLTLTWR